MSRRIDIELTSERPDGVWTWRAAGAKQPKGELDGHLLFAGAKVGDVVRADADFDIDGISVTAVLPPKGARQEPERLEIIGTPKKLEPVTTTLATRGKGDRGGREGGGRRDRGDRGPRGDRGERGERGPRSGDGRPDRDRRERKPRAEGESAKRPPRPPRPPRPEVEAKPKPKRLKAGRTHRNAVLADLPPEQRPVAEQVLKGGIPAVRLAVQKQNEGAEAEGKPPVKAEPLVALAEQMLPRLRTAEWRDKAEAALADIDQLDLRDLRSVIVAADTGARDDESRALADQLRSALNRRVEQEHAAWLAEIAANLAEGRSVRALRLSSRPPKAGAPLPPDMATRLAEATAASLTSEVTQDRWATVLDALAFSPVRLNVVPESLPAAPSDGLLKEVARLATQIPQIATVFGVEPAPSGKRPRPRPPRPAKDVSKRVPPPPKGDKSDKAEKAEKADKSEHDPKGGSDAVETTEAGIEAPENASDTATSTLEVTDAAPETAPSDEAAATDTPAADAPEPTVDAAPAEDTPPPVDDTTVEDTPPPADDTTVDAAPAAPAQAPADDAPTPEDPAAAAAVTVEASPPADDAPAPPAEPTEEPPAAEPPAEASADAEASA